MKIGFLRYDKFPGSGVRYLSALANMYNAEIFYFNPERIDIKRKIINGLYWDINSEQFIEKESEYPDIVDDIYRFRYQHKDLFKDLIEKSLFVFTPLGGKTFVYEILKKNNYSNYLIETYNYKDADYNELLNKHKKIVLKPNGGNQGKNVYSLTKEKNLYCLNYESETMEFSEDQFRQTYDQKFKNGYLIQPYIASVTKQGNPFDIRVNVRRGSEGKWNLRKMFVRIGGAGRVASNIHQGGSVGFIKSFGSNFLMSEFGNEWEKIFDELVYIARTLPSIIQKEYVNQIDDLGFDVAIDRVNNNELKFFEINTYTPPVFYQMEALETRFHYYRYLYKNLEEFHRTQNKVLVI